MLSTLAQQFANEIRDHDWSDAPYRLDRAGHRREIDKKSSNSAQLRDDETTNVRVNAMWVVAQVLLRFDPTLNVLEFAESCGVPRSITRNSRGDESGVLRAGLRLDSAGRALEAGVVSFAAVFIDTRRVGSTVAKSIPLDPDGRIPQILQNPLPEHPGTWERISSEDLPPVAYRRIAD